MVKNILWIVASFSLICEAKVADKPSKKEHASKIGYLTNCAVSKGQASSEKMEHQTSFSLPDAKALVHARPEVEKKSSRIMEECAHCQNLCASQGILG